MHSVLVVDDEEQVRDIVTLWVNGFGFHAREAVDAENALEILDDEAADIAICDINMPGQSGIWLAAQIRDRFPHTALIMATGAHDVETAIASLRNQVVDYLLKPYSRERLHEALLLGRDWHRDAAGLDDLQHALHERLRSRRASVAASLSEVQPTSHDALEGLISMLQLHERDGRGHATRVAQLALALADELGVDDDNLEHGALLHDIGKLDMPASILSKPAPLDDREWKVMRTHPQVGYDLLKKQSRFADAAEIVLAHHEAYDGTGYPRGLYRDEIPLGARILAVADAYDSMTHPHTQRQPLPPALAIEEIERCRGHQFDPDCAAALGPVLVHAAEEHHVTH